MRATSQTDAFKNNRQDNASISEFLDLGLATTGGISTQKLK